MASQITDIYASPGLSELKETRELVSLESVCWKLPTSFIPFQDHQTSRDDITFSPGTDTKVNGAQIDGI